MTVITSIYLLCSYHLPTNTPKTAYILKSEPTLSSPLKPIAPRQEASRLDTIDDSVFNKLFLQAKKYKDRFDYQSAIKTLSACLRLQPDSVDTLIERGRCYYCSGFCDKALKDSREAILICPTNAQAYLLLAVVYLRQDNPEAGIQALKNGVARIPNDSTLYYELANHYLSQKEYDKSLKSIEFALKLKPKDSDSQDQRALILAYTEKNRISKLSAQLQVDPKNVDALVHRGLAYTVTKNFTLALKDYQKALALSPSRNGLKYNIAACLIQEDPISNQALKVLGDLFKVPQSDINLSALYLKIGILCSQKKYEQALAEINKAIVIDKSPTLLLHRYAANINASAHHLPKALSYFNRKLAISPKNIDALIGRAMAYQTLEEGPKALQDLNTVIQINPFHEKSYRLRAEVYRYLLNQQYLSRQDLLTYQKLVGEKHNQTKKKLKESAKNE